MCRLAAFPPNFPKEKAWLILANFLDNNTDGTGSVYVKDGQFVVNKWATNLKKVWKRKLPLLDHMPYNGWTIAHLRAASHGRNSKQNTHPFIKGSWAIVHNGIWSEYNIVKTALAKHVQFEGETDTEVAAQLFAQIGPKKFFGALDRYSGVYLALNTNGHLWAVNTGGDLVMNKENDVILLASDLEQSYNGIEFNRGWIHLGPDGKSIKYKHEKIIDRWESRFPGSYCFPSSKNDDLKDEDLLVDKDAPDDDTSETIITHRQRLLSPGQLHYSKTFTPEDDIKLHDYRADD